MNRIALLVEHDRNRELLVEWLGKAPDLSPSPPAQELSEPFDLCIADGRGLKRHREALEQRRAAEAPCFLPVVLLTTRESIDRSRMQASALVDEFITMPAARMEFQTRLQVLLRHRRQSLELKNQLLDAQRMEAVGILAGGVVHDLNNILTVVQTCAALLASDPRFGADPPEEAEQIRDAVRRASGLTRRLLGFSRKQSGESEMVAPNEVVATTARILEATLGRDIEFVQELERDVPFVRCDPVRLEQVVMNLVVNAIEVLPDGGTIELATRGIESRNASKGGHHQVALEVRDTGPGMAPEIVQRIFDPFFTTKASGTGLGLASVARIVEDMGGRIEVDSAEGVGTTFRVTLPGVVGPHRASSPDATAPVRPAPTPDRSKGNGRRRGTVLVVDDDETICRIVTRILGDAGYSVLTAGSAVETVAILETRDHAVDAVLTDSILPGLSRADVRSILSGAAGRDVAVAFMSGYQRDEVIERLGSLGDAPFLHKPFTPEQLCRTVEVLMEGRGERA